MNILRSLFRRSDVSRARRLMARYEAAYQTGRDRSRPPVTAQHIFRDIAPDARRRLVDDSCDLVDNSPFLCGLIERMVTYVIGGSGIVPRSASLDEAFNTDADAVFDADAADLDFRGGNDWATIQAQGYRCELKEGDGGLILTDEAAPKVFGVEGRNIGRRMRTNSADYFDGIYLDSLGRKIAYEVRNESVLGVESVSRVDAKWFIHQFDARRMGQYRGVPLLASALNTARDIHDILALEKLAVKDASSKTDIITTATGEVSAEDLVKTGGATNNGADGDEAARYYREVFGPEARVIKQGDQWAAYQSDRPGPAWQGFMDFLSETVCLSAGIPPAILLQIKVGGADTRRDLAAAARRFEMIQLRIARQYTPLRNWMIQKRIDDGTLRNPPADWQRIAWQFPKSITVDAGREAQQDREDVRAGLMSQLEYHGRWGDDWRSHEAQIEREARAKIKRAKSIAEDEGVPFDLAMAQLGVSSDSPATAVVVGAPTKDAPAHTQEVTAPAGAVADIQKTALNGAQLTAVQELVQQVANGQLPAEAAKRALYIALPNTDTNEIDAMVDAAAAFEPAPLTQAPAAPSNNGPTQ